MMRRVIATVVTLCLGVPFIPAVADEIPPVAVIDEARITRDEFEVAVYEQARQTFYHGAPGSEQEYVDFRHTIANQLIDRLLLLREAARRGILPDEAAIAAELATYADRYGDAERWQQEGEEMLQRLRRRLEEDSVLDALEASIKTIDAPTEAMARDYYEQYPEKFTEPAKNRVSLILLAVSPNAAEAEWAAARQEAADILQRIRDGEEFGDLARLHSADPSARNGGDMGYLHAGMLAPDAQAAVDQLLTSAITDPVFVLEGIAIFKLVERQDAALRPFEDVYERAAGLWQRHAGDQVWTALVADLRAKSKISIDEKYLAALPIVPQ